MQGRVGLSRRLPGNSYYTLRDQDICTVFSEVPEASARIFHIMGWSASDSHQGTSTPGQDHELRLQDCASSGADKLSTTFRTPSTDCAVFSASSFSEREETLPVKVTVPLSAWICTVFKEIALVEYNSNSTRCASLSSMLSGFVCAFAALRLSVTPCTPVTCQAIWSAC